MVFIKLWFVWNSFLYCSTIFPGNALYLFHCHKWFRHDWRFVIIPDDHFLIVVSVLLSDAVWLEISIRMKAGAMTIMVLIVKKKEASIDDAAAMASMHKTTTEKIKMYSTWFACSLGRCVYGYEPYGSEIMDRFVNL
mgnify:CR=1 FL=1